MANLNGGNENASAEKNCHVNHLVFCVASLAYGEVTGTVKGPDGAPFEGAFCPS